MNYFATFYQVVLLTNANQLFALRVKKAKICHVTGSLYRFACY